MATSGLAADEQRLNQAKVALSALETLTAQRPGAVAAVHLAELDLSYCKVRAPFPGRVINLNISAGAYASVGVPVFTLLDTRRWYVMANFREGELHCMPPGTNAEVYLLSAPKRRFRGKVQGIGWAVQPEGETNIPVRCAGHYPRVELGPRRTAIPRAHRGREPRSRPLPHGGVGRGHHPGRGLEIIR